MLLTLVLGPRPVTTTPTSAAAELPDAPPDDGLPLLLDAEVTIVHPDATVTDLVQALRLGPPATSTAVLRRDEVDGVLVDGRWHELDEPLLGCGLRRGCQLDLVSARPPGADAAATVATLATTGGPLAGQRTELQTGRHVLGRLADVVVDHPTVSRRHLRLDVGGDGSATVTDLESRNGTKVDGRWCRGAHLLSEGAVVAAGAIRFGLRPPDRGRSAPAMDAPSGSRTFSRAPRRDRGPTPDPLEAPAPRREPPPRSPFSWSAAVAPLVIGLAMATIFGPLFAAFALLSPVAVVGSWTEHRVRARRHRRREDRRLARDARAYADRLVERRALLERRARQQHPDLAELARRAERAAPTLWERRLDHEDALQVRVGLADRPWAPSGEGTPDQMTSSGAAHVEPEVAEVLTGHPTLREVPVAIDLRAGAVGIVGAPAIARAAARALVLHLVTLHGPADVSLDVPIGAPWAWTRWLPHRRPTDGSSRHVLIEDRLAPPPGSPALHQPEPAIVLARSSDELPSRCTTLVEADGHDGLARIVHLRTGLVTHGVLLDGTTEVVAGSVARSLAPLTDEDAEAAASVVDELVPLSSVLPTDPDDVLASWQRRSDSLPVVLGQAADGPLRVDLVDDGPHTLIVGTTGSGKSELLRALVAGLAATTGPDDLAFVLVDFKGGSAFDRCSELPHVTGVVTDLDSTLARRVLRGLESELRLREERLRAAGAEDLTAFHRRAPADAPPMPRLVIVVDEFGVLATEAPEVLGGLVDVAQRGRSLGIHLVLATQRATGVVTDRIRANTSLRIALRTVDPSDSHDVIGTGEAADLDRRHPGRALVRAGGDRPRAFQVALTSTPSRPANGEPVLVQILHPSTVTGRFEGAPRPTGATEGPTELDALVESIGTAFVRSGRARPRRPWTDPLPEQVHAATLPGVLGRTSGRRLDVSGEADDELVLALADDPEHLRNLPWAWDPSAGHLVVHGAAGSGVTTALATAAHALHAAGWEVHVLDPTGSLGSAVAHLVPGRVGTPEDRDRLARLVRRLEADVRQPAPRERPTAHAGRSGEPCPAAPVAVVVDRWHAVAAALDDLEGMRLLDALLRALAAGPAATRTAVVGLDRTTGLPAALAPAAAQRLVLRLNDPHDAGLLGVPLPHQARELLLRCPPGRGVATPCGLEVQVARCTGVGDPSP